MKLPRNLTQFRVYEAILYTLRIKVHFYGLYRCY